uniref:ABC transporter domain-containing protein n=1 Tax=Steinernema glaseri TaxID=37863 RepID=A0A1I8AT75_9BILA
MYGRDKKVELLKGRNRGFGDTDLYYIISFQQFYKPTFVDQDDLTLWKRAHLNKTDEAYLSGHFSHHQAVLVYGPEKTQPFMEHLRLHKFSIVEQQEDLIDAIQAHDVFGVELIEAIDARPPLLKPKLRYKIYGLRQELPSLNKDWGDFSNPLFVDIEHLLPTVPLFEIKFNLDALYHDWIVNDGNSTDPEKIILEALPDPFRANAATYYMGGQQTLVSVSIFEASLLIIIIMLARDIFSEKLTGMRAYLGVMGICRNTLYLSHFIECFASIFLHCILLFLCLVSYLNAVIGILMFVTLIFYAISVASFVMFATAFCRSHIGLIVGTIILWFGSIDLPTSNAYFNVGETMSAAFSPNIALQYAFKALAEEYVFYEQNYAFTHTFSYAGLIPMWFMLLLHAAVATSAGLLLEAICPVNDCATIHPLQWFRGQKVYREEAGVDSGDLGCPFPWEMILRSLDDCDVRVDQLTKQFCKSGKPAVDRFSFKAYRNEVTVLLGHNGAGKSTAFNVMCGIERPTSGSVRICGMDVVSELTRCRQNLSYCPQTNPIFRNMTVREHLVFFNALKSISENVQDSERRALQLMRDLDILDLADKKAYKLSGGQLRKLCIGIAFAGDSPVVLLDEPTAGIDSLARKTIDDVIHRHKKGRTIILTTHYMDEAEEVGDRIAIMAKGRLCTYGSPEFLKRKFGQGYVVTIELHEVDEPVEESSFDQRAQLVQEFVAKQVPIWKFITRTGIENRIKLCLPFAARSSYAQLFESLEQNKEMLQIRAYTMHLNTMEQVFLAVGELVDDNVKNHPKPSPENIATTLASSLKEPRITGFPRFIQQVTGLISKRLYYISQSPKVTTVSIVFPVLFVLVALLLQAVGNSGMFSSIVRHLGSSTKCFGRHVVEIADGSLPSANLLTFAVPKESTTQRIRSSGSEHFPALPPVAFGFLPPINGSIPRILFNPSAYNSIFFALNVLGNARLGKKDVIEFSLESLPEKSDLKAVASSYFVPVVACFSLGMLISGSIIFLNEERRSLFQHQQYLTTTFKATYWMCQFLADFLIYIVGATIIGALLIVFNYGGFANYPFGLATLLLFYFLAFAPFIYCLSHAFASPTKAYLSAVLFDIMISFVCNMFAFALGIGLVFVDLEKASTIVQTVQYLISVISPTSALQRGIMIYGNEEEPNRFEYSLIFLTSAMTIYTATLFLLESRALRYWMARTKEDPADTEKWEERSVTCATDVMKDYTTVHEFPEKCSAVLAKDLYKSYNSTPVVNGLNFYVKRGECFALLGKNGAGKTTTFKMLTGDIAPESGTITIDGTKTQSAFTDVNIGYCPQVDSFLPQLTPWQNMMIMARLNGIRQPEDCVSAVLHSVDLMVNAHVKSGVLSGGQKRRLSVALSVLAEQPVILLDEPTTGIDPVARHLIWSFLSTIRNQGMSVVMTSHDMDECEAICSRVSFMRYGVVVATGSPCHLITTYSPGFGITISVQDPSAEALAHFDALLQEKLKTSPSISDAEDKTYEWGIPGEGEQFLSKIFATMEELAELHKCGESPNTDTSEEVEKRKFVIEDYTVESHCLHEVVTILSHSSREQLWLLESAQEDCRQSSAWESKHPCYQEPTEKELATMKKRMSVISHKLSTVESNVSCSS